MAMLMAPAGSNYYDDGDLGDEVGHGGDGDADDADGHDA